MTKADLRRDPHGLVADMKERAEADKTAQGSTVALITGPVGVGSALV